jgi:acetylornithine deacetylase/succinyl-diaminopimelate desuccinylase family protein
LSLSAKLDSIDYQFSDKRIEYAGRFSSRFQIDHRLDIRNRMSPSDTILEFLSEKETDLLQFTRDLIAVPSPTPPGDERAVAQRIHQEFDLLKLGQAEVIAREPERPNLRLRSKGRGRSPSLILNAHIDTKPAGNRADWKNDPFDPVIRDGKLYGLGSTDMKGAVAAMVYAFAAVRRIEGSLNGELQLLLVADEEGGSGYGMKYLAEERLISGDVALIGEPCGIRRELEFIHLASRGICCFRVRLHGDQMHSSLSAEFNAVNAVMKAAELLCHFQREFKIEGAVVNPGVVFQGGVFFGVVPGLAEFGCDIRVPPGSNEKAVREQLESWLKLRHAADPQLHAELVWQTPPTSWIAPVEFSARHPFVAALTEACARVLPAVPPIGCFPAATDAPWLCAAGIPAIPSFGPGLLPLAHSPGECVEIASLHTCARIYALAAADYLK